MTPDLASIGHTRATLWQCGYRPIPLLSHTDPDKARAGKAPVHKDWTVRARRDPPEAAVTPAQSHLTNTGILADGLRPVDVDVDDFARAAAIEELAIRMLGSAPTRRRTNSNRFCMLYRAAEGAPGKRVLKGTTGDPEHPDKVELLGKGQQFVAYGTHVTGGSIYWAGREPLDIPASNLPAVTEDQITAFFAEAARIIEAAEPTRRLNGEANRQRPVLGTNRGADPAELFLLNSALDSVPAELADDYDQWIRIGCALHHATRGSLAGRDMWDRWSQQSDKYDVNEIDGRWTSFASGSGNQVSAGTIFHLARQHGWMPPQPEPPPRWEAQHPPVDTIIEAVLPSRNETRDTTSATVGIASPRPPEFSENALAHLFTARHADTLIHVHQWGRWMHFDGHRWQEDHAVSVFDKARAICAEQGEIAATVLKRSGAKIASAINKASTIAAIERLARHHHRHVRHSDDFDADPLMLNASTTAGRLKGNA